MFCSDDALNLAELLDAVKARMNRCNDDESQDELLLIFLRGLIDQLRNQGIRLRNNPADFLFLVNLAEYKYKSRDNPQPMPRDLQRDINSRWIQQDPEVQT